MLLGEFPRQPHHSPPLGQHDRCGAKQRNLLIDRSRRREIARQPIGDDLEDLLRTIDVLQPVFAEVAQGHAWNLVVVNDAGGGAREEHLSTVRDGADSRGAMDGDAGVVVIGNVWLARVQTHANRNPSSVRPVMIREGVLSRDRAFNCIARMTEGDEERVALRPNLDSAVCGEHPAQQIAVGGEHFGVAFLEPLDQVR